jgi:hypothetical protein
MATLYVIHLKQIKEGTYFKGWMKIGKTKFDWELRSKRKFRGPFILVLKKNAIKIKLTDEEHKTFCENMVSHVMNICYDNLIKCIEILKNGVITNFGQVDFCPEGVELLNQPKFDCQIPD